MQLSTNTNKLQSLPDLGRYLTAMALMDKVRSKLLMFDNFWAISIKKSNNPTLAIKTIQESLKDNPEIVKGMLGELVEEVVNFKM